ncbi:MAG TPA: YciI family protein [Polyangia bacterium]
MKVIVFVKANSDSEAGKMPNPEVFREMGRFNEELVKAGVMLAGEGLQPSSKGKRVRCAGKERTVVDGPFSETKELVAGFWIWQVKSIDEAVEWVRRSPFQEGVIELRPIAGLEDYGDLPADVIAQEARLRAESARNKP